MKPENGCPCGPLAPGTGLLRQIDHRAGRVRLLSEVRALLGSPLVVSLEAAAYCGLRVRVMRASVLPPLSELRS